MYKNLPSNIIYIDNLELEKYITSSQMTIYEAMDKLNNTFELFQIIVDENNHVLGTLTDGDIRRGLLSGYKLDESVKICMKSKPISGQIRNEEKNIEKINQVDSYPLFLPIINESLILQGVLIKNVSTSISNALIVAGGLGSRLGSLTKDKPKPMLHIDGRPILEHCINKLEEADIKTIYISVNHMSEQIIDFIKSKTFKSEIIPIKETTKLGTIGSLYLIKKRINYPLLVMNADLVTSLSISTLISFYKSENFDGVITAATYETKVPYGILKYNQIGQLQSIEEKPTIKNLVAAGVYILNKNISDLLIKQKYIDMPELLDKAISKGYNISIFPIHEKWKDIGSNKDYYETKKMNFNRRKIK
jgi:dTDP-glucose pyrophosphorylase